MEIYSKILIFLVFGIALSQNSFSQNKYPAGYIITSDGDSVHGYINYKTWNKNPQRIEFAKEREGDVSSFKPEDIREFGVMDEIYISAHVELEISPIKTNDLKFDPKTQTRKERVFLQTMISGPKSLYHLKDLDGRDHFYIRNDSTIRLLIFKKYLARKDGNQRIIRQNTQYLGQLNVYLSDCPSIIAILKKTEYKKTSLEKLFLGYYQCTQSEFVFFKKTERVRFESGVVLGASYTSLRFKSSAQSTLQITDYSKSLDFSGGLFVDIVWPRTRNRWSFYSELLYTSYQVSGDFENDTHSGSTEIGLSYLKINNLLRYRFPAGKLLLFVNAGISNGFVLSQHNYRIQSYKLDPNGTPKEGKALADIQTHEKSLVAGVGAKLNRFSLELRYERGDGMSPYPNISSITDRIYFLFGYKF